MDIKESVTFEVIDSIGVITLNTPPSNELDLPGFIPLKLFTEWVSTPFLKGLIIKGAGRNFSAGGKLKAIFNASGEDGTLERIMAEGHALLGSIENLDIPVVAAINRICFGGGLEIALACHIRVASENALFAFPESNQNLMPGMGGTVRLPVLAGFAQSVSMILGGDLVNAADAKKMRFIDYIAPKDLAFEYSWSLMQKMTHDRPVKVIRSIMTALKNSKELSADKAIQEEIRLFCSLASDEAERRKSET
ncbi:MAG: enoyl-CoA hydratase/isomerase family protein [Bacteroidales bacterium]